MGDYEYDEKPQTVSGASVVCCFLFLTLILLGIALIIAGGIIYQQHDNYMAIRMKEYTNAVKQWESECEPKMKTFTDISVQMKAGSREKTFKLAPVMGKYPDDALGGTVDVTFLMGTYKPKKGETSFSFKASTSKGTELSVLEGIPLERNVNIPAICKCNDGNKQNSCRCKGPDMCGKKLTFEGDETNCGHGMECGRCKGMGSLNIVCLIANLCGDQPAKPTVRLAGCGAPFTPDAQSQIYGVEQSEIKVQLFDEHIPSVAEFAISDGAGITGPSKEQEESRLKGKILFGVGIPAFVLSIIFLIILCVCQKWCCFGSVANEKQPVELMEENVIPMHGLSTMQFSGERSMY